MALFFARLLVAWLILPVYVFGIFTPLFCLFPLFVPAICIYRVCKSKAASPSKAFKTYVGAIASPMFYPFMVLFYVPSS